MNIESLTRSTWWRHYEVVLISLTSVLFLGISASYLGVWELGEATHARLLKWMWTHETWMQVNIPTGGEGARAIPELAIGWWPSLISMYGLQGVFSAELSLRLPFFIVGGLCIGALYRLAYDWRESRSIALCAGALLLMTPAFSLGGRHMLSSGGLGGWFFTLSTLSLINAVHHKRVWGWKILGLGAWMMSASALGIVGALCPLIVWSIALKQDVTRRGQSIWQVLKGELLWLTPALIFVLLIYWRSWVKRANGVDFWSLFVTIDPLEQTYNYAEWGGFQRTLHLIGFGLFPLGAFVPVIFTTLNTKHHNDQENDRTSIGELMTLSFILSFFSVVLLAPSSGYWGGGSALISAPFALGVAVFLHEGTQRKGDTALHLLAVILLWIIIDSDLKRDPGLLLSALSGAEPKGLIPDLPHWRWARMLTLSALGWMFVYHTHVLKRCTHAIQKFVNVHHNPKHFHPALITLSIIGAFGVLIPQISVFIPRWVVANAFVTAPFWGRASMNSRLCILTLIGLAGTYWIGHLLWRFLTRHRLKVEAKRQMHLEWATVLSFLVITPHYLGRLPVWRFMRGLMTWMEETESGAPLYFRVILVHLWIIVIMWSLFTIIHLLFSRHQVKTRDRAPDVPVDHDMTLFKRLMTLFGRYGTSDPNGQRKPKEDRNYVQSVTAWVTWLQSPRVGQNTLMIWLVAALTFHQVTLPQALSAQLSHRDLLERYERFTPEQTPLSLYQVKKELQGFYLSHLNELTRSQFKEKAQSSDRSFFMIDRAKLSLANRQFREVTQRHLPILDDHHHQLLLASNTLLTDEEDRNPIKRAVIKELPQNVNKPKETINFENQVELVAWRATPKVPRAGAPLKLELFWRVKRRVRSDWKVFVHIDAPGQRIHGDHDPVSGVYPMRDWHVGDVIVDEHHLTVARTIKPATFTFFTGLYRGKTRMKIKNESKDVKDKENRAKIGRLRVQ